jgi:hypothetical protein
MAGSAYFMPASDSNGKPNTQDIVRWNDENLRRHEAAVRRKEQEQIFRDTLRQENERKQMIFQNKVLSAELRDIKKEQRAKPASYQIGKRVGTFINVGMKQPTPQQSFSQEQNSLRQMFGHGESMWGFPESHGPDINNDLHPSLNGDDGTASMFGFGRNKQRSGLF